MCWASWGPPSWGDPGVRRNDGWHWGSQAGYEAPRSALPGSASCGDPAAASSVCPQHTAGARRQAALVGNPQPGGALGEAPGPLGGGSANRSCKARSEASARSPSPGAPLLGWGRSAGGPPSRGSTQTAGPEPLRRGSVNGRVRPLEVGEVRFLQQRRQRRGAGLPQVVAPSLGSRNRFLRSRVVSNLRWVVAPLTGPQ